MGEFGKGIPLASGFDLGAKKPLDSRNVVDTIEERDAHVLENRAYEGMLVYVKEEKKQYRYDGEKWIEDIESLSYTNDNMPNVSNTKEALDTLKEETDSLQSSINEINDGNTGILIQAQNYARTLITELKIASFEIVATLPEINISKTTIYLLRYGVDLYELYIYTVDDKWEKIGTTKFDFSDYYLKEETDFLLNGKLDTSKFNSEKDELNKKIDDTKDELNGKIDDTKNELSEKIDNIDLSAYATKDELPTKTSELENDNGYLTEIPEDYVTKDELDGAVNDIDLENYYTKEEVNDVIKDMDIGNYYTKEEVDIKIDDNDCAYVGEESPEDDEKIWFSSGASSSGSGITYDNPLIQELFGCINMLQSQIQELQKEVEYLKIYGGGSGEPSIPDIITEDIILLEDGFELLLENGDNVLLESSNKTSVNVVLLEDGFELLLEDGSNILLENIGNDTVANAMLLENGSELLLENKGNILLEK